MKLATLKDGTRDGRLQIVSTDLQRMADASDIAPCLRVALDDWATAAPALQARFGDLEQARIAGEPFDPARMAAPLPRAFQWLDASVFTNHGALMARAFDRPTDPRADPVLMYQGASDGFIGPHDDILITDEGAGIDFEAEIGVVLDDVPMGVSEADAAGHIKLLLLINDVSLRAIGPVEMRAGFGFLHAKPATAFAPVAITPDEAGDAWRDGRLHLPVQVAWNGAAFGHPDAGEMSVPFPALIAWIARTRSLGAGTIIGSGTISSAAYAEVGSACIAERRAIEMIAHGRPQTTFMRFGDRVRISVPDAAGSLFGAIDQRVARYLPPA